MRVLFRDGYVFADMSTAGEAGAACSTDETCTAIAVSQAMSFGTLMYEDRSITLWPAGARAAADAASAQMVDVIEAAMERVEADMPDTELVCVCVCVPSRCSTWRRGSASAGVVVTRGKVTTLLR